MNKTLKLAIVFVCVWPGIAWQLPAQVTVFAAASLMESLKEVGADYEKQGGDKITYNFAGSSTLARQIEEGAPADIFFSADEAQMDRVERKELLAPGTRQDRLSNTLVIVVGADRATRFSKAEELAGPEVKRLALGNPNSVPAGVYARAYLEGRGLWTTMAQRIVPMENVRGALAAVESGDADAAIVYRTDALISKRVVIAFQIPVEQTPRIRYPIALLRGARDRQAAKRFVEFLEGAQAGKVFERKGFLVLP